MTSLSLLIREAFAIRHFLNVAKPYHGILENILNIKMTTQKKKMTTNGPGALTQGLTSHSGSSVSPAKRTTQQSPFIKKCEVLSLFYSI